MKGFFDQLGRIGEILAPVAGSSSTFFLAIQNHNNVEVRSILMNSTGDEMARANESGYSAIHCACRYNNMFAVDMIMGQDLQGNTPLHYAARYGHLDLCRILVERGSFAGKKNDQGQTAYDATECHTVRQYLLPLQFQSERRYSLGASSCNVCNENNCQIHGNVVRSSNYLVQTQHTPYSAEQHQYVQQNQYHTEQHHHMQQQQQQQNYAQNVQEQPQYAPSVHIPQAPRAGGVTINQSNSISTPISPPIITDNQPMNLPINIFHRNETPSDGKRGLKGLSSSGMSTPLDTAANSTASSPAKPGYNPHSNSFQHQIHNVPMAQISTPSVSSMTPIAMSPHSKAPSYSVPPSPVQQHPQQIPQNPHLQTPPNRHQHTAPNPHQAPPNQHQAPSNQHQAPPNHIQTPSMPAPNPHLQPAPVHVPYAPPVYNSSNQVGMIPAQSPPPVIQQAYKPAVANNSISRIIMPDGFHTSASDPELQRKYGHTKNIIDIAPPPIFNASVSTPPVYGMYNTHPPAQAQAYAQSDFNNMPPPQVYGWQNGQSQKHQ